MARGMAWTRTWYFADWAKFRKVAPTAIHELVRTVRLPTRAAQAAAVADLNRDGHPDIVFAFSAGFWEYRAGGASGASYRSPSRIYWGAAGGFDPARFTDLDAFGASDVAVADLNGDAWPEIVVANREKAGDFNVPSFVYWGDTEGFSMARRTELPTHQANAVQVHDIDADGDPDILFANGQGAASYAYVNDGGTFAPKRLIELPSSDTRGIAAEDLNGDGWPDVFVANHQQSGNPLTLSYLYWGSKEDSRRNDGSHSGRPARGASRSPT